MIWLVPFLLLTLGLAAALSLCASLRRELRLRERRNRRSLDRLRARVEPTSPVYVPLTPRSGMNQSHRVHALRLLRRGETPAHVAAALGIPRVEVDLLARIDSRG